MLLLSHVHFVLLSIKIEDCRGEISHQSLLSFPKLPICFNSVFDKLFPFVSTAVLSIFISAKMFRFKTVSSFLLAMSSIAIVNATLAPASSNTQGVCPATYSCSASKVSTAIQAAECSHNTRVSGTQTFAVFVTDHEYDSSHGAPYGTCSAYTCTAPTEAEMTDEDDDCWTFFWDGEGEEEGFGTNCIESPADGTCGCEDSDGTFVYGGTDCT